MTDFLLLGGIALCVISVVLAVVQLLRLQPPRAAAVTLIVGIVLILAAAYLDPQPFQVSDIGEAWTQVTETVQENP